VLALLGEYGKSSDSSLLLTKMSDGVRNDVARLAGARFVSTSETEAGRRLAETLVKQLVGGDTITARFLFSEFFEFPSTFKIWLATNHKPYVKGTDHAIWRRIRLISFNVTISPEEEDKELLAKLRAELPGILAWAVRGCLEWQRKGLDVPEEVTVATAEYREDQDFFGAFIEDAASSTQKLRRHRKSCSPPMCHGARRTATRRRPTDGFFGHSLPTGASKNIETIAPATAWAFGWHGLEREQLRSPPNQREEPMSLSPQSQSPRVPTKSRQINNLIS
jgi:hypothetical protein